MKLRTPVFMVVLALGALGLVRDVVTHGGIRTKDVLMLALGVLGLAQDVTSNGGAGRQTQASLQRQLQKTAVG